MPLGKRSDYGDAKYSGLEIPFQKNIEPILKDALLCGFDFVVSPLVRDDYRPPSGPIDKGQLSTPYTPDDVLYLPSCSMNSQVVGLVSPWINTDSDDEAVRRESVTELKQELAWAGHLGLLAVVLPPPPQPMRAANYSQVVNQALEGLRNMALWFTVPLGVAPPSTPSPASLAGADAEPSGQAPAGADTSKNGVPLSRSEVKAAEKAAIAGGPHYPHPSSAAADSWETWHQFRALTDFHPLLGCVLRLGQHLPPHSMLDRWMGEPVKALILPTDLFTLNKRGYPVLPKAHQDVLAKFFKNNVQVILSGERAEGMPEVRVPPPGDDNPNFVAVDGNTGFTINDPGESHPLRPYWEYLGFLFRKLDVVPGQDMAESDYRDYLQVPLQPLQDNLESQTYETFERDVMKYTLYEEAVYKALLDTVSDSDAKTKVTVLMVVGAGRGPLVRSSMRASERSGRQLKVFAVEKNPNAVVHIQAMLRREGWEDKVSIVSADMRHWQAPEQADILVSELLGSFGDNELSPECLDGAQRFLKKGGSYTSFLAPVTTHKLYNDVKAYKDIDHFETPYVVKFHK
eukprot:gene14068-20013_t